MRWIGRQQSVRFGGRPARRHDRPARLPVWPLLLALCALIGVIGAVASGAFFTGDFQAPAETPSAPVTETAPWPVPRTASATNIGLAFESPPTASVATPQPAAVAPAPTVAPPLPQSARLVGLRHEYQGWNNCAPTSLGMVLSYFDRAEAQHEIAPFLKPDPNDKNVSPHEIAAYAQSIGLRAHVGVAGDLALLKRLLAAGLPVIVEFWFEPDPDDGMGHYRVLSGYDEQAGAFYAYDSYVGPNVTMAYADLDAVWQVFNRAYVVVYPPESQTAVDTILTESYGGAPMWERALRIAQEEIARDQNDAFAWFNLGSSALRLGDTQQAVHAFDWARQLGLPWRMFWYQFSPFEAYWAQGRYQDVIALAEANLAIVSVEEWHYWRGRAREALGDAEGARSDYQAAVALNANFTAAKEALAESNAA